MMKRIKMKLKNCLNIGSEDSAMDYAFMFSAIESYDINWLSPEAYPYYGDFWLTKQNFNYKDGYSQARDIG